jgi:hypothetical protein
MIGKVAGTPWLARVKNGSGYALMLQVRFSDSQDVRTVQFMPSSGEDTVPVSGDTVAVIEQGGIPLAFASYDGIKSERDPGEKELYAHTKSGVKLASLLLKSSGLIWMGNRASGTNLRTLLENLVSAVNAFATACSASQTDPVLVTASAALGTSLATVSTYLSSLLDGDA